MNGFDSYRVRERADVARLVLVATFVLLAGAFFRTQVIQHEKFQLRAETNRLRPISLTAPRGTILDRSGNVIAENVPGYSVKLLAPNVDFQSRLSPTDQIEVLFSQPDGDDQASDDSELLYVSSTFGGQTRNLYRFQMQDGESDYFDQDGRSAEQFLLRKSSLWPTRHSIWSARRSRDGRPTGVPPRRRSPW